MAYAFDRIMGVMGRQKKDDGMANQGGREAPGASQANIFGRVGPAAGGGSPMTSDRVQAASTEGALPQGGAGGGPQAQDKPQPQQQTPGSRSRIFQANAGKVQSPVDLSAMGRQIQGAQAGLKNEANKYVTNATKPFDTLSDNTKTDIREFAGLQAPSTAPPSGEEPLPPPPGEGHIYNPLASQPWQEAFTNGPGQLKGFGSQVNTNITNADMLGTDAGIQQLFRQGGSAEYNAGDAAFDAALLRKNTAFNALREQTLDQNKALQDEAAAIGEATDSRAKEAVDRAYGGWRSGVEDELDSALSEYQRRAEGTEAQFDANITSSREKELAKSGTAANDVIRRLRDENPELSTRLRHTQYDPNAYMDVGGPTADDTRWQDFLGIPEAQNFNKVLSVLGRGGEAYQPGQYAGVSYGDVLRPQFDEGRFAEDMLGQAAGMEQIGTSDVEEVRLAPGAGAAPGAPGSSGGGVVIPKTAPGYSPMIGPILPTQIPGVAEAAEGVANKVEGIGDTFEDVTGMEFGNPKVEPEFPSVQKALKKPKRPW